MWGISKPLSELACFVELAGRKWKVKARNYKIKGTLCHLALEAFQSHRNQHKAIGQK